ncbi:MAG: hypothetical protein K2X37_04760 [Chitinophagaceae bacterium]|nr:hypothetical protein [Chitinophagaceae bacterium]
MPTKLFDSCCILHSLKVGLRKKPFGYTCVSKKKFILVSKILLMSKPVTMKLKLTAIVALVGLLSSCGPEAAKEKTISVGSVNITGDGSKYLKVVPGDYTLKPVGNTITIPVKIELTASYSGQNPEMGNLSLIPLDKSGAAVPDIGLNLHPATVDEWAKVGDLLKGNVGKVATISFEWEYFADKERLSRIMKETEGFELSGADFTASSKSESTTGTTDSQNAGSEDWDKVLADYESYVDDYVKLYKKAKQGDQSALADYPAIMEKATNLQTSLQKAQNTKALSSSQIAKMVKIQTKMLSAVQ